MAFTENEKRVSSDTSSSVYSRSPDIPKYFSIRSATPPPNHDLPEINSLDHQIAQANGSTIALETTRSRLQGFKPKNRQSLQEIKYEKLVQYEHQKNENDFYKSCRDMFHELFSVASEVSQSLLTQHDFEPENNPSHKPVILAAARALRAALERSRVQEARAEQEWKRQWNPSRIWKPTTRWI